MSLSAIQPDAEECVEGSLADDMVAALPDRVAGVDSQC